MKKILGIFNFALLVMALLFSDVSFIFSITEEELAGVAESLELAQQPTKKLPPPPPPPPVKKLSPPPPPPRIEKPAPVKPTVTEKAKQQMVSTAQSAKKEAEAAWGDVKKYLQEVINLIDYNSPRVEVLGQTFHFDYPGAGDPARAFPILPNGNCRVVEDTTGKKICDPFIPTQRNIKYVLYLAPFRLIIGPMGTPDRNKLEAMIKKYEIAGPVEQFVIKFIALLITAYKNKDTDKSPGPKEISIELWLLLSRLAQTQKVDFVNEKYVPVLKDGKPQYYLISDVINSIPDFVKDLLNQIIIEGKTALKYLEDFSASLREVLFHKFEGDVGYDVKTDKLRGTLKFTPEESKGLLSALVIRAYKDASKARKDLAETLAGKTKYEQFKQISKHKFQRTKTQSESINDFLIREFPNWAIRSDWYQNNKDVIDPIFDSLGIDSKGLEDAVGLKKKEPIKLSAAPEEPEVDEVDITGK